MRCRDQALNQIRRAREQAGLTREQLAVRAGVSSTTLYLAERAGLLSPATAGKIAPLLGVTPEALLAESAGAPANSNDVAGSSVAERESSR